MIEQTRSWELRRRRSAGEDQSSDRREGGGSKLTAVQKQRS